MKDKKDSKQPVDLTEEELELIEKRRREGTVDIRSVMIDYAKRYNGYPYISASRIECEPPKGVKGSTLYEQLTFTYMVKNAHNPNAIKDFMEVFGSGRLVFFQAHKECPTLGPDGLFNTVDLNGNYIDTMTSIGYYALADMDAVETDDEVAEEGYKYYYRDANGELMDCFVKAGVPMKEYYRIRGKIFKRREKPEFTPLILVKQGPEKFGIIEGNPFHEFTPEEVAAVLQEQREREAAQA